VAMGKTLFRHLPKRMFTSYRWGPGEGGVRGERRGMAGTPRTRAVSIFVGNDVAAPMLLQRQRASLKSPSPPWAPVRAPRKRGFVFLASSPRFFVLTVTFEIPGARYQKCSRPVLAASPSPDPPFARARSLRLRHQLQRPQAGYTAWGYFLRAMLCGFSGVTSPTALRGSSGSCSLAPLRCMKG